MDDLASSIKTPIHSLSKPPIAIIASFLSQNDLIACIKTSKWFKKQIEPFYERGHPERDKVLLIRKTIAPELIVPAVEKILFVCMPLAMRYFYQKSLVYPKQQWSLQVNQANQMFKDYRSCVVRLLITTMEIDSNWTTENLEKEFIIEKKPLSNFVDLPTIFKTMAFWFANHPHPWIERNYQANWKDRHLP